MSEKVNLYVKFIQNEQKRLNNSTVVASRYLNEAQTKPEAGAPGPASGGGSRVGLGGMPIKPRYTIRDGKVVPKEPTPKKETISPSAPRPELKTEPLQVGKALVGAAGLVGGGAAILSGTEERKQAEAERTPKQETPAVEPPKKQPPKAETEPPKTEPSPEPPKPEGAPKSSEEDEEAEKYVAPIERRYRAIKKESLERFINMQKPRVPNSSKFPDVLEQTEQSEPNQQRQQIKKAEQKFKDLNIKDRLLYNQDPVVQDAARKGVREYEKGMSQRDDLQSIVKQAQQAQLGADNRPMGVDKENEQPKTASVDSAINNNYDDVVKAKANSLVKQFKDEKWEDRLTNNEDPVIADQARKIRDKFNKFQEKRKNVFPKSGDISRALKNE